MNASLSKTLLTILALGALSAVPLSAQTPTNDDLLVNGDNGTVNLEVTGTNGVLFGGTYGSGAIPATGAGTRMMWYPKKAAFRAGRLNGASWEGYWDDISIGNYSFAAGYNNAASGDNSIALGAEVEAVAVSAVAIGSQAYVIGDYSVALGSADVFSGTASVAIGSQAYVDGGDYATAIGQGYAEADYSTAIGAAGTVAPYSVAIGYGGSYVEGIRMIALGYGLQGLSYASTVLGHYNAIDFAATDDSWQTNDELLVVGNGTASNARSNAIRVRKNANMRTGGKIEAKGVIRAAPGGDLSMGSFDGGTGEYANPATLDASLKYSGE